MYIKAVKPSRQDPRSAQRRRTRAALLAAATQLIRAGEEPSVARTAEVADISRRTAYRYFPTQEQLLTEATLEQLRPEIERSFEFVGDRPEDRVAAVVRAMQAEAAASEPLLRTMIRLTVERPEAADDVALPIVRGSRRIDWIEGALAPAREVFSPTAFARLVSAISFCVGAEALIVLRDIRGLDRREAAEISVWAARALVRAALADPSEGSAKR